MHSGVNLQLVLFIIDCFFLIQLKICLGHLTNFASFSSAFRSQLYIRLSV